MLLSTGIWGIFRDDPNEKREKKKRDSCEELIAVEVRAQTKSLHAFTEEEYFS